MNIELQEIYNPADFFAQRPERIGTCAGVHFYSHPKDGHEVPLVARLPDGTVGLSDFYDVPSLDEVAEDSYDFINQLGSVYA